MNKKKFISYILFLTCLASPNISRSIEYTTSNITCNECTKVKESKSNKAKILLSVLFGAAFLRTLKYIYNGEYYWDKIESSTDKSIFKNINDDDVIISFINIGSGDCTLIQTKNTSTLIDCGWTGFNFFGVTNPVYYLRDIGVKKIDNIIMTHDHIDHQGLIPAMIESFKCKNFYFGYLTKEIGEKYEIPFGEKYIYSYGANALNDYITKSKIIKHKLKENHVEKIKLEKNINLTIYCPEMDSDINNNSLISILEVGNKKVIFVGDQGVEAEKRLIKNSDMKDMVKDCNILKVGHHGDSSSSCAEFIKYVDPDFAIVSNGTHVTTLLGQLHCQNSVCKRIKTLPRNEKNEEKRKLYVTQSNGNIVCSIIKGSINFNKNNFGREYNAISRAMHSTMFKNKDNYIYDKN